jgi:tRNA pseudouridine55 synthase
MGKKTKDSGLDGLFVIDKPPGITSHDAVGQIRRITAQRRCGHSGTLDPGATGVLLVALGTCTRLLQYLDTHTKSYVAEMVLGSTTSTLDNEGEVLERFDMSGVTIDQVRAAAARFVGEIQQIPPMVSAVKVDGKRLHEYAREGIEVERKLRPVTIYRYEIAESTGPGIFPVTVDCSTGTYVRTLVADVGEALGGGAHLQFLRRTAIGPFTVEMARPIDGSLADAVPLTAHEMLAHLPAAEIDAETAEKVKLGSVLDRSMFPTVPADASVWKVSHEGHLMALYEPFRLTQSKPALVLSR